MEPTTLTEQAEQAEEVRFVDELDIRTGMTVEVLTLDNRLTFVGKVESYHNGAIVIREAKGNELPPVLYNKEIKLRFFRERSNLVIHGKICGSTNLIWKLDRLESKYTQEQRAFFRQSISPDTAALCSRRAGINGPAKKAAPCQILDVSAGGMLISSREEYEVNDRLSITGIYLAEGLEPFSFSCQVRRVGKPDMGVIRYGCQFEALPPKEQDRLLRAIFVVQREEIRSQKDRDEL